MMNIDTVDAAVEQQDQVKLGSLLAEVGRKVMPTDEEFKVFANVREHSPAQGASFDG